MLWLVVLSLLVVGSQADDTCCSVEDRREVLVFWKDVWGAQYTDQRVTLAQQVFLRLFKAVPATKALFANVNVADVNSPKFKAHCVRIINGLDVAINLLDDPDTLNSQLAHLNGQHKARPGVKASYFKAIGEAFAEVLPTAGSCFNPAAWQRCFDRITEIIAKDLPN